jgi:hypothetical protein
MASTKVPVQTWLDKSAVISFHGQCGAAPQPASHSPHALDAICRAPIGRRQLLQAGAAGAIVPISAHAQTGLAVERTAQGFAVSLDGKLLWDADSRWLAEPERISVSSADVRARIAIAGVRYPGTDFTFNLAFGLAQADGRVYVTLNLGGAQGAQTVDLQEWVAGSATLRVERMPAGFSLAGVRVTTGKTGSIAVRADLGLDLEGGVQVAGRALMGSTQSCRLAPLGQAQLLGTVGPAPRAMAMTLSAGEAHGALRLAPGARSGGAAPRVAPFAARQVRIELRETPAGLRHAMSAEPSHALTLHDAADGQGGTATLVASNATYVESGAGEQMVVAQELSATVRSAGAVLLGAARGANPAVICTRDSGYDVDCSFRWESGAFVHEHGVHVVLRASSTPREPGRDVPDIHRFLNAAPWQPDALPLNNIEIEFLRPEDSLWMRFQFRGYELRRGWRTFEIARVAKEEHARMWAVFPPQAVSEQSYFRAPRIEKGVDPQDNKRDKFGVPVASNKNEERKAQQQQAAVDPEKRLRDKADNEKPSDDEPVRWPVDARVAGESSLCLVQKPGSTGSFALDLANMLDPDRWSFVVADAASSSLKNWRESTGRTDYPKPVTEGELPAVTHIEMPWRLHISPDERASIQHAPIARDTRAQRAFQRAFYVGAHVEGRTGLPLRAIYTPDFRPGQGLPLHYGSDNAQGDSLIEKRRHELDENDRAQIKVLSADWGVPGLLGSTDVHLEAGGRKHTNADYGIYEPQPFDAELFRLTARGGSMRSRGRWDPPYLRTRDGTRRSASDGFALSLEEWTHVLGDGRTHFARTVYLGYILPYGHRAALIRVGPREIENVAGRGPVAVSVQRYYIRIVNPSMTFPRVEQPPESLNSFCNPETFTIDSPQDLQIDNPANWQLAGLGPSAFVICRGGGPHAFGIRVASGGAGTSHLAFVDNTVTHDAEVLKDVVAKFNALQAANRSVKLEGVDVTYAPGSEPGETTWPTHKLTVGAVINKKMINSVLLESRREPPFYPVVERAEIVVRSIDVQTGDPRGQPVGVYYDALYKRSAFDGAANPAKLYLDLEQDRPIGFRGRSDRSAGVANTDSVCKALARGTGPVGFRGESGAVPTGAARVLGVRVKSTTTTEVSSEFAFDKSAKILGNIPLTVLLEAIGLEELPELVEDVERRLDAAGKDLLEALPAFFAEARDAVQQASARWTGACTTAPTDWCTSQTYLHVKERLDAITTALGEAVGHQASGDMLKLLGAIAKIGASVDELARALKKIADNPDLLLADLLKAADFNEMFDWVRKMHAAVQQNLGVLVSDAMELLVVKVTELVNEANAHADYARQLLDDLESRSYALVTQMRQHAIALREEFCVQLVQWRQAAEEQLLALALDALGPVVTRLAQMYAMYQGLADELRLVAATYNAELKAWMLAAKEARAKIDDEFRNTVNQIVFGMLGTLETWVQDTLYNPAVAGAAEMVRRLEPDLRAIRDISLALRAANGPVSKIFSARPARAAADPRSRGLALANVALVYLETCIRIIAVLENSGPQWSVAAAALREDVDAFAKGLQRNALEALTTRVNAIMGSVDALAAKLAADPRVPVVIGLLQELAALRPPTPADAITEVRWRLQTLLRMSSLPRCVLDAPSPAAIDAAACLREWPAYEKVMKELNGVVQQLWVGARPLVVLAKDIATASWIDGLQTNGAAVSVFGAEFFVQLKAIGAAFAPIAAIGPNPTPADLQLIAAAFNDGTMVKSLRTVIAKLDVSKLLRNLEGAAIAEAERQIRLLAAKFVPAKVSTSYDFEKSIVREYCGIFLPGTQGAICDDPGAGSANEARLVLKTSMEADLLEGTSLFTLDGEVRNFRINILNFMELPIASIHFRADTQNGFRMDPPEFCTPNMDKGPLVFIKQLMALLGGDSGFFMMPLPRGVRAGFYFGVPIIQAGGMTIQNFGIEAALMLPFEDRSAEVSFAVASREAPMLISVGIWGGGGFFEMVMAMDRVISISASFEFGLVGAFELPAITGQGRVTVGLYYRQAAGGTILEGFFYAGGSATVLSIVSICADLTVRVREENGGATGEGRFGVSVGAGPFKWTLRYSVSHSQHGGSGGGSRSNGRPLRIAAAGSLADEPVYSTFNDSDALLSAAAWDAYRAAFEE